MKVFIINVSSNEIRRKHILSSISPHSCINDYLFIHDGDLETINNDILTNYFGGELSTLSPAVSCAYKHILAYYELLNMDNIEYTLILEDDIILYDKFCENMNMIVEEVKRRKLQNFLISLEDSYLKYINASVREKNKLLYKKSKGRMAGAYLIDKKAAKTMVIEIEQNKCNLPIDWFHNYCSDLGILDIYWAHPPIAIQGSLNGKLKSIIDNKPSGIYKIWLFKLSRLYKIALSSIR